VKDPYRLPHRLPDKLKAAQAEAVEAVKRRTAVVSAVKALSGRCPDEWAVLMDYLDEVTSRPLPTNSTINMFVERNARRAMFLELKAIPETEV